MRPINNLVRNWNPKNVILSDVVYLIQNFFVGLNALLDLNFILPPEGDFRLTSGNHAYFRMEYWKRI